MRNIAAAATAALIGDRHANRTYTLTGPQALTHAEMAAQLSEAVGRRISFIDIAEEAMRDALSRMGMPEWQADGLIEDYAHYRRGEASEVCTGVQDATTSPPRSFAAFARDYAWAFS